MPAPLRDSPCLYCGKLFTRKSVYEHERHSCRHSPKRVKRSYGKKKMRNMREVVPRGRPPCPHGREAPARLHHRREEEQGAQLPRGKAAGAGRLCPCRFVESTRAEETRAAAREEESESRAVSAPAHPEAEVRREPPEPASGAPPREEQAGAPAEGGPRRRQRLQTRMVGDAAENVGGRHQVARQCSASAKHLWHHMPRNRVAYALWLGGPGGDSRCSLRALPRHVPPWHEWGA